MPPPGFSNGQPHRGSRRPEHEGPPGRPGVGPGLSCQSSVHAPRSATQMGTPLDSPSKAQSLSTPPRQGALPCLHPQPLGREGRRAARWRSTGAGKGGSDDAANAETLPQRATGRFPKIGKKGKKKKLLGCNLFLGNMLLKGIYMPWKQIPEAQFRLISAKLATANEHCNCQ